MTAARAGRGKAGVVVAHPGRQHVQAVVLAAQEAGVLQHFATSVFLDPQGAPLWLAERLAQRRVPGRRLFAAAVDRSLRDIDATKVKTFPLRHVGARIVRIVRPATGLERSADVGADRRIARWLSAVRPAPAVVVGFEGVALETFRAAREIGAITVLDVPIAHEEAVRVAWGNDPPPRSRDVTRHVREERELADHLLVPSDFVRRCLVANGVAPERLLDVPYGVDAARFSPRPIEGDRLRVLFVGGVVRRKGIEHLIRAWDLLDLPNAELTIVGAADAFGSSAIRSARQPVDWRGKVPRQEILEVFGSADVFVFPSLAEGSANVVFEAMACGLPVVTTPESGSVITHGHDGLIVPAGDPAALAAAITTLCESAELRGRLGRAARATILRSYTSNHYRSRLAAVFAALLAGSDPRAALEELA